MASGRALAMPAPKSPRPITPANEASTSKAPPNPRPATSAPDRNTPTDPKRETRRSPTSRPSVTAPRKTPRPIAPRASVAPEESATYIADQFRPAPSASVKQKASVPTSAMGTLQPLNHRLKPPMFADPSPDRSSSASTREGSNRGEVATPATTATTAQA